MINGDNANNTQTTDSTSSVQSQPTNTSEVTPTPVSSEAKPQTEEKMLKQSEVNKLIGSAKHETYEKAKRDALAEIQRLTEANRVQPHNSFNNQQFNGQQTQSMSDDRVRQLVMEEAQRMSQQATANQIAQEFVQKINAAKEKYPDFDEVVSRLNLPTPQGAEIVRFANSLDNTADVIYDIGKNPTKYANLLMLLNTAPQMAVAELHNLSSSIKKNQDAANSPKAPAPLSQVQHSTAGTDNGSMGIVDYKKQPWARF